jgi:hypothetical protein
MEQLNRRLRTQSHSFDTIEVVAIEQEICVKKTFVKDLARAKANVEKQRHFPALNAGPFKISAAEVLRFEDQGSEAALLMPYVEGLSGEAIIVHGTRKVAQGISEALSLLLYNELARSHVQPVAVSVFGAKARAALAGCDDPRLLEFGDSLKQFLERQGSHVDVPIGACHGDLTLSNLIFNPVDGILLIDFLHTYLESPLQDVAKVRQDYDYGWSFRNASPAVKLKGAIFCAAQRPVALSQIQAMYPVATFLFTALVLLRIVPYSKDEATRDWVAKSLASLFERLPA